MSRLELPSVTLCAATSVNLAATIYALARCRDQIKFGETLLLTDKPHTVGFGEEIKVVHTRQFSSSEAYSLFLLKELAGHIRTEHCLIVQWDGFVIDASRWDPAFLEFDYIGAPWPQFSDGHDVGNGGFSLRSRRLLEACRDPEFQRFDPEDLAICRANRRLLEDRYGIKFADRETASSFSHERGNHPGSSFGFHGVFNMIPKLGADCFWQIYESLDHRGSVFHDLNLLLRQLGGGAEPWKRRARLVCDRIRA